MAGAMGVPPLAQYLPPASCRVNPPRARRIALSGAARQEAGSTPPQLSRGQAVIVVTAQSRMGQAVMASHGGAGGHGIRQGADGGGGSRQGVWPLSLSPLPAGQHQHHLTWPSQAGEFLPCSQAQGLGGGSQAVMQQQLQQQEGYHELGEGQGRGKWAYGQGSEQAQQQLWPQAWSSQRG